MESRNTEKKRIGNKNRQLEMMKKLAVQNAKSGFQKMFGIDFEQIKSYELDTEVGKFYNVDAPDHIIECLRQAGLLKE